MWISTTNAYAGLPISGRNKMGTTAHYLQWLKIDLFGNLSFKKIADCVILLAQAIKMPPNAVFYVQQVVQMEKFMLVLLKYMNPRIITVCHTTIHAVCNIQQLSKDLPLSMPLCNCILKLDSACSSPLTMHFLCTEYSFYGTLVLWLICVTSEQALPYTSLFGSYTRNGSITYT